MCTVTFIPYRDSFFITSNRDESPDRQATGLTSRHDPAHPAVYFPLDESSGGSWIALNNEGRAVCLLNGGFEFFRYSPPYRLSRGQVVLAASLAEDAGYFLEKYTLEGIAPFTLLVFEAGMIRQMVWDGHEKYISAIPPGQPQIWSSVTLYPPDVRAWRKDLFEKWLSGRDTFDRESILQFHRIANGDGENDFVMNRNNIVKTLSITNIITAKEKGAMLHLDLDRNTREEILVPYAG